MDYQVLLVEGETTAVWMITQKLALERRDLKLERFADPYKLLARLQVQQPSLLITDLKLKQLSSPDLLMKARQIAPNLPVLVVTSSVDAELREKVLGCGVTHLFEKPINLADVLETINQLLPAQTQTNWQDILAENNHMLEPKVRNDWRGFDAPRQTNRLEANPNTAALRAPKLFKEAGAMAGVAIPDAKAVSQFSTMPLQPVDQPTAIRPAAPPFPADYRNRLNNLCTGLVNQLAGAVVAAVVDLHNEDLLAAGSNTEHPSLKSGLFVKAACDIFRTRQPQSPADEGVRELVNGGELQEVQLVFQRTVLFGKTTQQGRLGVLLLTESNVNLGLGWWHLKAALEALETGTVEGG